MAVAGKALVVLVEVIHGWLLHHGIEDSAEHVNGFAANIAGGVDLSGPGLCVGKADQGANRDSNAAGAGIAPERYVVLSAKIRATSKYRGAEDTSGIGNLQLHSHKTT